MLRRHVLLLVTVTVVATTLGACGGGVATVGGSGGDGGGADGATGTDSSTAGDGGPRLEDAAADATREANAPGCPAAYTSAPPGHCSIGLTCAYDQGRCECVGYCGGPPPPPDTDFSHWTCTPKRDDGCPDARPMNGAACTVPAKSCSYGVCCVETFTCGQSGKWASGGLACPP